MADPVKITAVVGLPPEDTVRAFDARGDLRTTVDWREAWHGDHARAFTVAKIAKLDLLEDVRTSLADVVHNGGTFEQWQANIIPTLQRAGWWGKVQDPELTGTTDPVFVGSRRLRNIFLTNMKVSRAAGQWTRIQARKHIAPYLAYSAVDDDHARRLHALWGGLLEGPRVILHVDDPAWDWLFPPNDWGCRCSVIQLSQRDLDRLGWKVSPSPPSRGPERAFWRPGASQPEMVPAGIGPGWEYNPGRASMRAISDKAAAAIAREAAHDFASAQAVLTDLVDSPALLAALDEPDTAFPVMLLDQDLRDRVGAGSPVVTLSGKTFAKQRVDQPSIGPAQYRQLQKLSSAPDFIAQEGDLRQIFMRTADGRWLKAVVKVGGDGVGTTLESLTWADAGEVAAMQRRALLAGSPNGGPA
jgi:Phage Mu protein F like protein